MPYLNLFCDATKFTCNSPVTLAYISAFRDYDNHWNIGETGANLDGKVFDLPGGPVLAAVGFGYFSDHTDHQEHSNFSTNNTSAELVLLDPATYNSWDSYIQVDIPFVGEANKFMFVQALDVQVSGRYDHYNTFGPVWTPKVDASWTIGWGLKAIGGYGTSFRAPIPAETSEVNGGQVQGYNPAAGQAAGVGQLTCNNGTTAQPPVRWTRSSIRIAPLLEPPLASVDPAAYSFPAARVCAQFVRSARSVHPERAQNFNFGGEFKPTDFLAGLDIQATYYNLRINGSIANNGTGSVGFPPTWQLTTTRGLTKFAPRREQAAYFFVPADPSKPITDAVQRRVPEHGDERHRRTEKRSVAAPTSPISRSSKTPPSPIPASSRSPASTSTARYDFDLGQLGAWNVGVTGTYLLMDKSRSEPGLATVNQRAPCATGEDSGGRLCLSRTQDWAGTDDLEGWTITAFVNHLPHSDNVVG